MQDEINQRTVAIIVRAARLDASVLKKAIGMYLEHRRRVASAKGKARRHGEVSVAELMGMDQGAKTIEINPSGIKDFIRCARKYNVDFAVKKDAKAGQSNYKVFFKGRDDEAIAEAFRDYVAMPSRPSLRRRLMDLAKKAKATKQAKERTQEKTQEKTQGERSL